MEVEEGGLGEWRAGGVDDFLGENIPRELICRLDECSQRAGQYGISCELPNPH